MRHTGAFLLLVAIAAPARAQPAGVAVQRLAARGGSPAAFDARCIPGPPARQPRWGPVPTAGVAPRSNTGGILTRRALSVGRIARLGATRDFHHGLLGSPVQDAGSPAPPEIDLPAFVGTVDRIASDIERADPRRLTGVLVNMPSRLRVKAGNQHFDVPFEPIAQMVAGATQDPSQWLERRRAIQRQLLVIRSEAVALLDDATPPAGAHPHAALTAILARKEFARAAPAGWTARVRARLTEWLLGLWDRVGGNRLNTRRAAMTLVWLSTLAAIAGLVFWFHRNMRRRMARGQAASAQDVSTPARGWALHALTAIRAGRASEAVRFAYRAAITRLAELGVWRIDEARTAREYVTLLTGAEARDGAFRDIAGQFERVVYANRSATAEDLVRLADHLETLGCVRPHERAI